jgi:hypothetical protein
VSSRRRWRRRCIGSDRALAGGLKAAVQGVETLRQRWQARQGT